VSAEAALAFARSHMDIRESPAGSNKGPHITQWEVDSGYPWVPGAVRGVSWCQCFANAVAHAGGAKLIRDGYTPNFLAGHYRAEGYKPIPVSEAEPGDFIYWKWPGVSHDICDHVGVLKSKTATTITDFEGNTSSGDAGSQNNGGQTAERTRSRALCAGAVRVPYKARLAYRFLDLGTTGSDVEAFQTSCNHVASTAKRPDRHSTVDGECGPETLSNGAWAAFMLGIGDSQADILNHGKGISPYVQHLVRNPAERNTIQKDRGKARMEQHSG
jgi:hypothetical protein